MQVLPSILPIQRASALLSKAHPTKLDIDWEFIAPGWLQDDIRQPEKTWRSLETEQLLHSYTINAIGPALLMKQLLAKFNRTPDHHRHLVSTGR
jgi:hypothetical protein